MRYDSGDRPVGSCFFTINKEGNIWRISSELNVDIRFLSFRIRLRDKNGFVHDETNFQSFRIQHLKVVPLQRTVQLAVSAVRNANSWTIQTMSGGILDLSNFPRTVSKMGQSGFPTGPSRSCPTPEASQKDPFT